MVETLNETTFFFNIDTGQPCRPPHRRYGHPLGPECCPTDGCIVDETGHSTCGEYACPRCGADNVQVGGARCLCNACGARWEP